MEEMKTTVLYSQLKGTEPFYEFPAKSTQSTANIWFFFFKYSLQPQWDQY